MGIDLPLCLEDINNILGIVVEKEKLKNPKIVLSSGSEIGEGYLGINCSVEVSDENKTLHLFLKAAPKLQQLREKARLKVAYQNEFRFYNNIYPVMEEFYKERTGQSLEFAPKFYTGSIEDSKEIFVMENLKEAGFDMNGAKNVFDKEQLLLIMKEYGRFHGISFALKDQQEEVFDNLSRDLTDFFYLIFDTLGLSEMLKMQCKIMERYLQSPDDAVLLEKVKYIAENVEDLLLKFKNFNGQHRVILHGDCNHNNLMFRKQKTSMDIRFIDFQGVRFNSPVLDVSYFIYAAALSEENLEHLDLYLDAYYKSLSSTIKGLGNDPGKLCTMSVIKEHWNIFSVFGLIMAMLILPIIMNNEASDIVEITEKSKDNPPLQIDNEEEYARRIKYLLKHFVDNKFV